MFCNINNWGHPLWCIIHIISYLMDMNSNNVDKMIIFLDRLQYIIPCQYCQNHYVKNINEYLKINGKWNKKILHNKKILIYSLIIIHQSININNNKNNHSVHYYYNFWEKKKNKKTLLKKYINNLRLCENINEEIYNNINNIQIN